MTPLTKQNKDTSGGLTPDRPQDFLQIKGNMYRWSDTCHVYLLRAGSEAVLVDFGDGSVLANLAQACVSRVTDILMTHHHRDQGQGLARGIEAGARLWVPHTEQDLFSNVEEHWQGRELYNNYNVRHDLFSLLESVPINGTLQDYALCSFGGFEFTVLPAPGQSGLLLPLRAQTGPPRSLAHVPGPAGLPGGDRGSRPAPRTASPGPPGFGLRLPSGRRRAGRGW